MPRVDADDVPAVSNGQPKRRTVAEVLASAPKDIIAPDLLRLDVVPLARLVYDPCNARLHPEKNLEAIQLSLALYGQQQPLVVRRGSGVVIVGNGRLKAARQLGWTRLAVSFVDVSDVEAIGYGLADNRTAELAKWDVDVAAALNRLVAEAGVPGVGWSDEELLGMLANGDGDRPDAFPEVDEGLETNHRCPRCGFSWSGGERAKG